LNRKRQLFVIAMLPVVIMFYAVGLLMYICGGNNVRSRKEKAVKAVDQDELQLMDEVDVEWRNMWRRVLEGV
jgi:uncharacterized protein YpmB